MDAFKREIYAGSSMVSDVRPAIAWYAIRTRSRFEKKVALGLRGKGYEEFLPVRCIPRPKADRTVLVKQPLFAGYVFCRFDNTKRLPILMTAGVSYIVSTRDRPSPIPDEEIASLQRIVQSGLSLQDWPYFPGAKIRILAGPLSGLYGTVIRTNNKYRVIVSINILKRSVSAEVGAGCLEFQDLRNHHSAQTLGVTDEACEGPWN
jgi:transcriptional antiterminator RfaH